MVREELGECTRCKLSRGRKQIVFGVGNPEADLVFVGEAPGADEDEQGEPFVGAAGQLLTQMISAMGFSRATSTSATSSNAGRPTTATPSPTRWRPVSPS